MSYDRIMGFMWGSLFGSSITLAIFDDNALPLVIALLSVFGVYHFGKAKPC